VRNNSAPLDSHEILTSRSVRRLATVAVPATCVGSCNTIVIGWLSAVGVTRPRRLTGTSLAAAAIAASVAWMLKPASAPSLPLARFTITLPTDEQFSNVGRHLVALSPDSTHITYVANGRLYIRAMDQLDAVPIRGTEGSGDMSGRSPFFSPDGQWIGFWQDGALKKVSITGGAPVVLCAALAP
jgi:WD40-like Beta Propeller Repeat